MSSSVFIEFNKNDFFYVNAGDQGFLPNREQCNTTFNPDNDEWTSRCNRNNFANNGSDCIKKELCKNRANAEKLIDIQNTHTGADFMGTVNLGIGCLFLGGAIYMNR